MVLWVCSRCPSTVNVISSLSFSKITLLLLFVVGFGMIDLPASFPAAYTVALYFSGDHFLKQCHICDHETDRFYLIGFAQAWIPPRCTLIRSNASTRSSALVSLAVRSYLPSIVITPPNQAKFAEVGRIMIDESCAILSPRSHPLEAIAPAHPAPGLFF